MRDRSIVPAGYHRVSPYLRVDRVVEAIAFYEAVLGAVECIRFENTKGKIGYSELKLGEATIMMGADGGIENSQQHGDSNSSLYVFVDDVDKVVHKAKAAGAQILEPPEDKFYGDRTASFKDPYGHSWTVATHFEDVTMEELKSRGAVHGMILKKYKMQ
ncbi:MAG: VOC family protein [Gammaproteobacteria bacterium]|nr:VOC family protein [Gammaproteobacteria bacterium]